MRPRLICCSSSSGGGWSGSSRSAWASKTAQYDVKPTSTANRTTTRTKRLTIGRFTAAPRVAAAPAGRRARSETSSSSASSTKLATIELPP